MTTWSSIDASQLLPASLVSVISTMASILDGALKQTTVTLDVPSLPDLPDPNTTVVNALLDAVSKILEGGRLHVLAIPITKTIPPTSQVPSTLDDLQAALDITLGPSTTSDADAYTRMLERAGGNAGFYRAFAESLMDLRDPNRPQYEGQTDAVAMTTLLVGAPSFAAIVAAASTLELLVRPKGSAGSMTARTVPTPQNLTARVVGAAGGHGVGIRLDWDPPIDAYQARYFPGVAITVKRYAVIRSTDARLQSARGVLDLFKTQRLTEGLTNGPYKVIQVGSGRNAAYLDTDADPSKPAFYAVTWECEVREAGRTTTLAFDRLSNVAKITPRAPTPAQTGTSPNWSATDSAVVAFPSIAAAAQRLVEEARVLLAPSSNPTKRLKEAVARVEGVTTRLTARSTELMSDVSRIATALSQAIPRLYVTRMSSGAGGNAYLLAELAKRLGNTNDSSRPPFDHGEYVCGICFVAGAPRLADLASAISFLDALFGPADAANPLLGVLAAIDTLVTQAETVVFQPDMTPSADTSVDPLTGRPPVTSTPATADSGVAVASDDPQNPDAGDTNVTPTSSLC